MDRDEHKASFSPKASKEIPRGGPRRSPDPRPATITEETRLPAEPHHNGPVNQPPLVNIHPGDPVLTVQLGSRSPGLPPNGHERVNRYNISDRGLEELDFPQRLAVLGGPSLFGKTNRFYDIELATLQRMAIHDLQHRLVHLVAHIHNNQYADEGAMDMARRLLDEYCKIYRLSSHPKAVKSDV